MLWVGTRSGANHEGKNESSTNSAISFNKGASHENTTICQANSRHRVGRTGHSWARLAGSGGAPATQDNNRVITLAPPSFLLTADAEGKAINSFLEDEAGISVYFKAPTTINLSLARKKYRTIEVETPDYIIGSVPVGNNPESEDVHVYTNRNGWMVAYYLAPEPPLRSSTGVYIMTRPGRSSRPNSKMGWLR